MKKLMNDEEMITVAKNLTRKWSGKINGKRVNPRNKFLAPISVLILSSLILGFSTFLMFRLLVLEAVDIMNQRDDTTAVALAQCQAKVERIDSLRAKAEEDAWVCGMEKEWVLEKYRDCGK